MNKLVTLAVCAALATTAPLPALAAEAWRTTGFSTPESVVFDGANNRLIVSNIAGDPVAADGNGTLATVGLDGKIIAADWVKGLDAPKGLAIAGDKLYVADINKLRIVDLASGEFETVDIAEATFLNDVAVADDGAIYVSDTFNNAIYRFADGKAELFVKDAALQTPNGLLVDGGTIYVASIGALGENPADNKPGGVYTVDIATRAITKDEALGDFGNLDGFVKVDDSFIVSDFMGGKLFKVTPGGSAEEVATMKLGAADIGTDGTSIYVPQMMEGELVKFDLD